MLLTLMPLPTALAVVSGPRGASVGLGLSGGPATVAVPGRVRGPGPRTGRG